ncbi:MAG TPA: hypothetical protein VGL07_17070 [Buttiauxella sp.]|jgi:phage baseplate assembly protein W
MEEIDFLMSVDADGITTYPESQSKFAIFQEWLATPEGSIYGKPAWGNRLNRFKHNPTNTDTEVAIENYLIPALQRDIPQLNITGIRCETTDIQTYILNIQTPEGGNESQVKIA